MGKILQNTKYMGDDLYPPLISKDLFHKAQEKRKEKTAQLGRTAQLNSMNNHHAFTNRIFCGECGEPYRKYVEHCGKPQEKVRWKCKRYIFNNKVQCRNLFYTEEEIKAVVTSALNQLLRKRALLTTEYDEQIEKLQQQMLTLIEDNAKQGAISEDFDEEYHQLSEQINELKTVRIQVVQAQKKAKSYKERVDQLDKAIATVNPQVREFDQDLVKRLISSIRVHKGMKLEIQFHSGIVVKQEVDYYE